jgi:hypothetical protein
MTNVYEIETRRKWKGGGRSQSRRKRRIKNMSKSLSPLNKIIAIRMKNQK